MSTNPTQEITAAASVAGRQIDVSRTSITVTSPAAGRSITFARDCTLGYVPTSPAYRKAAAAMEPGSLAILDRGQVVAILAPAVAAYVRPLLLARLPGMYMTEAAERDLKAVYGLYAQADRRRDYPGDYHPLKLAADRAMDRWRETYPGAALLEDSRETRARAREIKDSCCDLDGSLSAGDVDAANARREARRAAMRAEADGMETRAAGLAGVEVVA